MNTNKQTGEETMNESYKDKFNAQMKKAGICFKSKMKKIFLKYREFDVTT